MRNNPMLQVCGHVHAVSALLAAFAWRYVTRVSDRRAVVGSVADDESIWGEGVIPGAVLIMIAVLLILMGVVGMEINRMAARFSSRSKGLLPVPQAASTPSSSSMWSSR
ncbi:hypothetical protein BDV96DRAFT_587735 [Lophiotrema nucula]|uniref:DUF202 domain-containing protein n=1 Tax=Lophiotrema nucula TaxID=690887 RepID=A0A6A5YNV8_9PLEO|nr:hypothetical protein BDV96DRAFT_587735 [Lophiotrema nucula]